MATERVFPATPFTIGGGRILPSPNQFYLTGEDSLRIVSANALPGVAIKIQLRTANIQSETIAHSFDHVPNADRSIKLQDYPIGTGSLLNATVFAGAGSPRIGQTYVMIQLVRGSGAAAVVLGTLLAGCITATQALGFPGSPILSSLDAGSYYRAITGTAPGLGLEVSEACPTGARWELLAVETQFTTSAAAGTRILTLHWDMGGISLGVSAAPSTVAASQQGTFTWELGMPLVAPLQPGVNVAGIADQATLLAGDVFRTQTSGLDAGDRYNYVRYAVREWLEV